MNADISVRENATGWFVEGPSQSFSSDNVWSLIARVLSCDRHIACLQCGDLVLSRQQVLDATAALRWPAAANRVGVLMSRSAASVIVTLSIWRQRATYVPLAVEQAASKIAAIVARCDLDLIVTDRADDPPPGFRLASRQEVAGTTLFLLRRDRSRPPAPEPAVCCIAHTSGSTGDPKGVRITHAALANRIRCMQSFLEIVESDCVIYKSAVLFDVHLWEFALPLASSCRLVIHRETSNPFDLFDRIAGQRVTIAGLVPGLLQVALRLPSFLGSAALRCVLCGGEGWHPALARDFYARMPGRKLYNSYGPTETTVAVANWPVPDGPDLDAVAIGHPLANTVFRIEEQQRSGSDGDLQILGRLWIGGAQVTPGYVDTAGSARFAEYKVSGRSMRFYDSGDLVRLDTASGLLYFRGRSDLQAKINGVRIELVEVEEAIVSVAGVEGCVAFVAQSGPVSQLCAAYCAPAGPIDADSLRHAARRHIPSVITLSAIQHLTGFPTLPSGKIDRAAVRRDFVPDAASPAPAPVRPAPCQDFA